MAATSQYLEKAYDKIFKWLSLEFRQMGKDAQLEVGELMREGVQRLRKRQELLTYVFFSSSPLHPSWLTWSAGRFVVEMN